MKNNYAWWDWQLYCDRLANVLLEIWRNWNIIIINNIYCQSPVWWGGGRVLLPEMKRQFEIYRTEQMILPQSNPAKQTDWHLVLWTLNSTRETWPERDSLGLRDVTSALTWVRPDLSEQSSSSSIISASDQPAGHHLPLLGSLALLLFLSWNISNIF